MNIINISLTCFICPLVLPLVLIIKYFDKLYEVLIKLYEVLHPKMYLKPLLSVQFYKNINISVHVVTLWTVRSYFYTKTKCKYSNLDFVTKVNVSFIHVMDLNPGLL